MLRAPPHPTRRESRLRFVTTIHLLAVLDSILGLLTAFVLGTPVGPARQ
jgi:hypothetical protein